MQPSDLSPAQAVGVDWLADRPGSYLADCPGFGKTRQLLAVAEDARFITVVCPAAVRDARVWTSEAKLVGVDTPMRVMSYHELAKSPVEPGGALIFDEAHRLKSRKVQWGPNADRAAAMSTRVHLASGTPTPNGDLTELYSQMRLINPELPDAYWKNKSGTGWIERWFTITSDRYSQWVVNGTLLGCLGKECEAASWPDCEHRQEFWAANVGDLMLRRPETMLDLPDMAGNDTPLETPMTPVQKRAYRDLKKTFLADLPEGVTLEALTASQKFVKLWQASTGLSSVDPEASGKHSGKANLLAELLPDRAHPTVLGVYFKNTALAMVRICQGLGLTYVEFGANTTSKARGDAIERFQGGGADVLIGSISVISEGLTLTAADQVILVERAWVPGVNEQTVRRVRRRGQTKSVVVRQLVTPNSVDSAQWDRLADKDLDIRRSMGRAEVAAMLA